MGSHLMEKKEVGFTLIELLAATGTVILALLALAAVLLSSQQQQEQSLQQLQVLNRAQSLMEEIRGANPTTLIDTYHGTTYAVEAVNGGDPNGNVLFVSVDGSDPLVLFVTITVDPFGGSVPLVLTTQILNNNS